jgi:endonuclease I
MKDFASRGVKDLLQIWNWKKPARNWEVWRKEIGYAIHHGRRRSGGRGYVEKWGDKAAIKCVLFLLELIINNPK